MMVVMTTTPSELEDLVGEAILRDASAIDFAPSATAPTIQVRLRIGGVLVPSGVLPLVSRATLARLLHSAQLDHGTVASARVIELAQVRWRVAVAATVAGPHVLVHRVPSGVVPLDRLGLDPDSHARVVGGLTRPGGMTIISGPPGAGTTTTFYAALAALDLARMTVVSIEDPVEQLIAGVHQREWRQPAPAPGAGDVAAPWMDELTRAKAELRSVLLEEPDAVGVATTNDLAGTSLAFDCAAAGVRVIAAMPSTEASAVPVRFFGLGIDAFRVAAGLRNAVCQRLLRLSCPHCVAADPAGERFLALLGEDLEPGTQPRASAGCDRCARTGFVGAIAIFEVLDFTGAILELFLQGASTGEVRDEFRKSGATTFRRRAAQLVADGRVSIAEALRVVA